MPVDPSSPVDPVASELCVDVAGAMELVQMLTFLGKWLDGSAGAALNASLQRFAHDAYDTTDLRTDLARFAFLLSGDSERLPGPN